MFTIVLDGFPFIMRQYPVFRQLSIPWKWIVVEGAAGNTADTSWCQPQEPRWSNDGTNEYLCSINDHSHVEHWFREWWANKTEMCNFAVAGIKEPCVLMQIDADEIYQPEMIERIMELFAALPIGAIRMRCRYWVGESLVCEGQNCWSNWPNEYERAWRWEPGMKMITHEPPKPDRYIGRIMEKEEAWLNHKLIFDHYAYATEMQVSYKEKFYGYKGLFNQWRALQAHDKFPVPLSQFFAHVSGELPKVVKV